MMQSVKHIFFKKLPWKEFFLIVVAAFAGNSLTSLYQERLWERQNNDSRRVSEIAVATKTFEELSSAIDRRIYRMDKLDRWMHDNSDQKMIDRQMKEYRDILYEWNDSYNKNKAKVRLYFGDDIADRFDYMHYFFKETGKSLEDQYYTSPNNRNSDTLGTIGDRIGDLNNIALEINESMIKKIQRQEVGFFK